MSADQGNGNGGTTGEGWRTVGRVELRGVVVENDPDKSYAVVRLDDGTVLRLPKEMLVQPTSGGDA